MTRFDRSMFSRAAECLLRQDTEIILSPLSDALSKQCATDRVFNRIALSPRHEHGGTELVVDAVAAALLRMSLSEEREQAALSYMSKHLDLLQPEKSVQVAFAALKHVQFSLWAMAHARDTVTPEHREARKKLENEKLADFVHQMDRLAGHNPNIWEMQKQNFLDELVPLSFLSQRVRDLTMPPRVEEDTDCVSRHDNRSLRRIEEPAFA